MELGAGRAAATDTEPGPNHFSYQPTKSVGLRSPDFKSPNLSIQSILSPKNLEAGDLRPPRVLGQDLMPPAPWSLRLKILGT